MFHPTVICIEQHHYVLFEYITSILWGNIYFRSLEMSLLLYSVLCQIWITYIHVLMNKIIQNSVLKVVSGVFTLFRILYLFSILSYFRAFLHSMHPILLFIFTYLFWFPFSISELFSNLCIQYFSLSSPICLDFHFLSQSISISCIR